MSGAFYNEWERYPAQWIRNGNAIVAPLAAEFIGAVMDELDARSAA